MRLIYYNTYILWDSDLYYDIHYIIICCKTYTIRLWDLYYKTYTMRLTVYVYYQTYTIRLILYDGLIL